MSGSPQWSLSLRFPNQNPVYTSPLPHTRYMPRPSHSSRFYHPHNLGKEISLDVGMLGWRGRLRFRVYNPGKTTKYGILVRMVCKSSTGYICNLQIYDGKCRLLTEMVGFLLKPYEGRGYHLYQDNYYNSVHQMNELLQKLIWVCGTIRVNRGLPKHMKEEAKKVEERRGHFS